MSVISFSRVLTVLILGYIIYSMSSFYKIFHLEECTDQNYCIYPRHGNEMEYELSISGHPKYSKSETVLLELKNIKLNNSFTKEISLPISASVKNNKSYSINAVITPSMNGRRLMDESIRLSMELTKLKIPVAQAYNLLNDKNSSDQHESKEPNRPEMHLYNKIIITTLMQPPIFNYHAIPHEVAPLLKVGRKPDGRLLYEPIAYLNKFLLSGDDLVRVNGASINVTIELGPVSVGKLRLWRLIEHATHDLGKLGFDDKSIDSVRGIFTHTNFYLLVVTFSVAALHLLFDILSFKNDISFWRQARSTEGLSGKTVMWRCVSSVIIFLYLIEEHTSLLVLVPFAISTVIEFWKLSRVFKVRIGLTGARMDARDSGEQTTDRFDSEGMKYLMWLVVPLCAVGAVYSLFYLPHKSWYSWTVNTLANGVYVFGFMFMMPQLFINYKLKSVAHLPWKALTYKAFNTFIDDFFAFIITMPTSHRLACFRDDIVFVIYIYQRWLYPVDKTRVNEFGQSFQPANQLSDGGDQSCATIDKKHQ